MPRPRIPLDKAQVSGAVGKNAGRFKDRKGPSRTQPVGEPYEFLDGVERLWWAEYVRLLPWLHASHRPVLLAASRLTARLQRDPDMPVTAYNALSSMLTKMGATPADETKVKHGEDDGSDDPGEGFFARPN